MNSVKILHCADIHIDAAVSFLGEMAEKRKFETLLTFEKIVDAAVENNVKILAIAGDLFDNENPSQKLVDAVFNKIASAKDLYVIYSAGNHDPLNTNSPFLNKQLPENLFVLGARDECITFDELKTRVYGRSFEGALLNGEEEFSIKVPNDDYINIMVQHGELKGDLSSEYNSITPKFIKNSGMDYIALGHVHKRTPIGKMGNTFFAYSGCPEGQGFDELDDKGVYIGEISKNCASLEFLQVAKRKHLHLKLDVTGCDDILSLILKQMEESDENYADHLYKIELVGSIPSDTQINLTEITARLSERVYFAKIKDSTEYKIDFESLSNDPSLKGIFVKNMLKKIKEAPDNKLYKKALKIGLKAFNSEVKYNEN